MNSLRHLGALALLSFAAIGFLPASVSAKEKVQLVGALSPGDSSCLSELLREQYVQPDRHTAAIAELSRSAKLGRISLTDTKEKAYLFLFENSGWCGSAGCLLLVGEKRSDGHCHLLYVSDGTADAIDVLKKRDHGYRRLYTPCEARFDGRQYQQVHEECPTLDIQR